MRLKPLLVCFGMAKWYIYLVIRVTETSEICNETSKKSKGIILSGLLAGGELNLCQSVACLHFMYERYSAFPFLEGTYDICMSKNSKGLENETFVNV